MSWPSSDPDWTLACGLDKALVWNGNILFRGVGHGQPYETIPSSLGRVCLVVYRIVLTYSAVNRSAPNTLGCSRGGILRDAGPTTDNCFRAIQLQNSLNLYRPRNCHLLRLLPPPLLLENLLFSADYIGTNSKERQAVTEWEELPQCVL